MKKLLVLLTTLIWNVASAVPIEIWNGSMNLNLAPCSTLEWSNDGPFGTPSPTYRTEPQVKHGRIVAMVNDANEWTQQVRQDCEECAIAGVAAATVASLFSYGSGGWPTFQSVFYGCLISRVQAYRVVQTIQLDTWNSCG